MAGKSLLTDARLPQDFLNPNEVLGEGSIKLGVLRTLRVAKRFSADEFHPVNLRLY